MKRTTRSAEYYNLIADEYAELRTKRSAYLNKIDSLIISDFFMKAKTILDVGAGDGSRGLKIFQSIRADEIWMVEESKKMFDQIKTGERIKTYLGSIQNFQSEQKFDLILCLWNVLGHIDTFAERVQVLKKLKNLLSDDGVIVIDLNNRHNFKHYGVKNVIINVIKSIFMTEPGWFLIRSHDSTTKVYIHSYFEIKRMISSSGLKINSLRVIDYDNGDEHANLFKGQFLFYLQNE